MREIDAEIETETRTEIIILFKVEHRSRLVCTLHTIIEFHCEIIGVFLFV